MHELQEARTFSSEVDTDSVSFAIALLAVTSSSARAKLLVATVVDRIVDCACVLYRVNTESPDTGWIPIALAGDLTMSNVTLERSYPLLAPLLNDSSAIAIYAASDLTREDYSHLNLTRSVASIAYLPMVSDEQLIGAVELVSFSNAVRAQDLEELAPLLRLATPSLVGARQLEHEKETLLDSVHRMTQLYDLEKSLNATLDLDQLMALIPRKVRPMLTCEAVHLWLFVGTDLTVMATAGTDYTMTVGSVQRPGEGYVAEIADEGVAALLDDPEDPRLKLRSGDSAHPILTAMVIPLLNDEDEIGVLEAVNKADGSSFNEDDEFFFTSVAETVSSALKNASLMHAERKLAILEALVHVSSEITSTLRLERLLQIIVNSPQNVLPYERSSIALDYRGKLQLKAISGMASIPFGDAQVDPLIELLRWLAIEDQTLHLRQPDESVTDGLPEAVGRHFQSTGYRGLFALPLHDDQGRVGLLLYESSDPDFLEVSHTEMIKILAGQATVAIRNALLYREVPLISLLEPLLARKQTLLRTSKGRRFGMLAGTITIMLFLLFCPLPIRLAGDATVGAEHLVTVSAPVDGTINTVLVHEGARVESGQVMATMDDLTWQTELNSAQGRLQTAMLSMENDLARGSAQAGADRAQVEYLQAEVARAQAKIASATLRSPIAGIVMTPSIESAAGKHLDAGASFAQVLDLSSAIVDVSIPQADASLLKPGQGAVIKLESYPQRTWRGYVAVVAAEAQVGDGVRTFTARVPLSNKDATLRAGMTGRAKVFVGYRSAGYVLLRRPALWIWETLWDWFGW